MTNKYQYQSKLNLEKTKTILNCQFQNYFEIIMISYNSKVFFSKTIVYGIEKFKL